MKFTVLTLFPEIPRAYFENSIMAKAVEKGIIAYELVNIRDFAFDKHKTCDDSPYGGGAGMVLAVDVVDRAIKANSNEGSYKILMTPQGSTYSQKKAMELSKME